jgi:hypothetical protein
MGIWIRDKKKGYTRGFWEKKVYTGRKGYKKPLEGNLGAKYRT